MIRIKLTPEEEKILILAYFNMLSKESAQKAFYDINTLKALETKSLVELDHLIEERQLEKLTNKYKEVTNAMEPISPKSCYQKALGYPFTKGGRTEPNQKLLRKLLLVKQSDLQCTITEDDVLLEIKFFYSMQLLKMIFQSAEVMSLAEWYVSWREIVVKFLKMKGVNFYSIFNEAIFYDKLIVRKDTNYYEKLKKKFNNELVFFVKLFDDVFDYREFISGSSQKRFLLAYLMKTHVCPYCNRQYISVLEEEERTTSTFDHYKREASFPMLKISLFNLVPSCYACNSLFKGKKDDEHLYPWENDENELRFSYEDLDDTDPEFLLKYYNMNNCDNVQELKILIEYCKDNPKAYNSVKVFKLQDAYQIHNMYASNLVAKAFKYEMGNYKKELLDFLSNNGVLSDEKKIDEFLYGIDFDNSPESKADMNVLLYKLSNDLVKKVNALTR